MMTLPEFLRELAANNDRTWFAAHRDIYDGLRQQWLDDLGRLFNAMSAYEPAARYADPKRCCYRIYRDTRFSPDKTPFKTFFSAELTPHGRKSGLAGWYIQAGYEKSYSGLFGGLWSPDAAQLRKLRHAIVDNIEEFEEIINSPALTALYPGWWGPTLKTIPKGWPKDHPQAPLLRLLHYGRECEVTPDFFTDTQWPERAAEMMQPLKPLIDFLNYSLTEE